MQISAKADYAIRALVELALAGAGDGYTSVDVLASRQRLPAKFLESIFTGLRKDGLLVSRRGAEGGYRLARPGEGISVADIIRSVDGPLAAVRGLRPEDTAYEGAAAAMPELWVALRAALRLVLENVSLADLAAGELPAEVRALSADPDAWLAH
ncbi:MAG TPA: Rrf2 family transcriptional regulator [Candidatus Nanopelagicales bacterium]|jgi:Rrf2 family protein|nr:Rrf2 family transcriptional regulator [Candidatus Nanopelagicales bacterium]